MYIEFWREIREKPLGFLLMPERDLENNAEILVIAWRNHSEFLIIARRNHSEFLIIARRNHTEFLIIARKDI